MTTALPATQHAYLFALAAVDTCRAAVAAETTRRGFDVVDGMTDEAEMACYVGEETVKEELGYYRLLGLKAEAEKAMVAWAMDHACAFSPAHEATIRDLHTRAARSVVYWSKLVDVSVRLAAA